MALPPKGDPRRPLHLAIRSMRVLGIFLLLFSGVALLPLLLFRTRFQLTLIQLFGTLFYLVPGLAFFVLPIFMKRRKLWALITALVLVSIQECLLLLGSAGVIVLLITNSGPINSNRMGDDGWIAVTVLGFIVLVLIAIAQLIYHLARSFPAMRMPPWGSEERVRADHDAASGNPARSDRTARAGLIAARGATVTTEPPDPLNPARPVDPARVTRSFRSAARAMRILATILIALAVLPLQLRPDDARWRIAILLAVSFAAVLPGAIALGLAIALTRQKFWAVIASLVLTCGDLMLVLLIGTFIGASFVADRLPAQALVGAVIPVVLALPFSYTIYHLTRAFEAMKPDDWTEEE